MPMHQRIQLAYLARNYNPDRRGGQPFAERVNSGGARLFRITCDQICSPGLAKVVIATEFTIPLGLPDRFLSNCFGCADVAGWPGLVIRPVSS
jgi:hypothetical protein